MWLNIRCSRVYSIVVLGPNEGSRGIWRGLLGNFENNNTTTVLWPFFQDHPGELVPGVWWHAFATLFFSATTHYFSKNIVLRQVCHNTLLFQSQHIIFSKDIVLCTMSATQYFLKK